MTLPVSRRSLRNTALLTFDDSTHTYYWDGEQVPGANEIAKSVGLIDTTFMSVEGAERGKRRHKLLEDYERGEVDWADILPEDSHILVGWDEFKRDMEFQPISQELKVFHPDLWVAGTIDVIGKIQDTTFLVDFKTGSSLSPWYRLQLGIYALAYAATVGESIPRMGILHLRKAKKEQYRFVPIESSYTLDMAHSLICTYHMTQGNWDRAERCHQMKEAWIDDLAAELGEAVG